MENWQTHEVSNQTPPLENYNLYLSDKVLQEAVLREGAGWAAEQLQAELHQLTHIVDQSLLIAKAEQGRLKQQPGIFDLAQLVGDVAEDFALLAREDERTLRLETLSPCPVQADPKHTRQILHNLFTNALKHGSGSINVRLSRRDQKIVLLIANGLRPVAEPQLETLGLGLRVVDTLLGLQPEIKYTRRRGRNDYLVRLTFPVITSSATESRGANTFQNTTAPSA